jgi:hypothetical protein
MCAEFKTRLDRDSTGEKNEKSRRCYNLDGPVSHDFGTNHQGIHAR